MRRFARIKFDECRAGIYNVFWNFIGEGEGRGREYAGDRARILGSRRRIRAAAPRRNAQGRLRKAPHRRRQRRVYRRAEPLRESRGAVGRGACISRRTGSDLERVRREERRGHALPPAVQRCGQARHGRALPAAGILSALRRTCARSRSRAERGDGASHRRARALFSREDRS